MVSLAWEPWVSVVGVLLGVGVGHLLTRRSSQEERRQHEKARLDAIACNVFAELTENLETAKRNRSAAPRFGSAYTTDGWDRWKGELFQELLVDQSDVYQATRRAYVQMKRANYYLATAPSCVLKKQVPEYFNAASNLIEDIENMIKFALVKIEQIESLSIHKRMAEARKAQAE